MQMSLTELSVKLQYLSRERIFLQTVGVDIDQTLASKRSIKMSRIERSRLSSFCGDMSWSTRYDSYIYTMLDLGMLICLC